MPRIYVYVRISETKFAMAESLAESCPLCNLLSPNLRAHISHIRQVHSKQPNFSLVCGIDQCPQVFTSFGAFNSHVYRKHRASLGLGTAEDEHEELIADESPLETPEGPSYSFVNEDHPQEIQYDVWHLRGVDKDQQQRRAAKFVLKLKEVCNVSERTVGEVVTGYRSLLSHSIATVKASVKDSLGGAGLMISDIQGLEEAFSDTPDVFQGLETTYLQEKYFKDHFNLLVSCT